MPILEDYNETIDRKELVSTDKFRIVKFESLDLYPYALEYFSPTFGWEIVIDLSFSDLVELITLIKLYTEEK